MTKHEKFHIAAGLLYLVAAGCVSFVLIKDYKERKAKEEVKLEDCAEMNQENDSTIFQEKPIQTMKPAEKKKIFDRFKPLAKTVVAKKLLDEVLENRDILITIHLEKGDK